MKHATIIITATTAGLYNATATIENTASARSANHGRPAAAIRAALADLALDGFRVKVGRVVRADLTTDDERPYVGSEWSLQAGDVTGADRR